MNDAEVVVRELVVRDVGYPGFESTHKETTMKRAKIGEIIVTLHAASTQPKFFATFLTTTIDDAYGAYQRSTEVQP